MNEPIIIIGGGVTGLSIGWHLVRLGAKVALFEKEKVGSGASCSSAGMITPASEVRFGETDLLDLFKASLEYYPQFITDVQESSRQSTDFHKTGSLMIAIDCDDEADLNRLYDYQKELGLDVSMLSKERVLELEPLLSPNIFSAIEAPGEFFLDSTKLVLTLKDAFIREGGELFEQTIISRIDIKNNRVLAVGTDQGAYRGFPIVMASGLECSFEGLPDDLKIPLRPVKGQAFDLQMPKGVVGLSRAIRTIHRYPVYIVPRSDGRITIGATLEEMGMNRDVTAGALLDLIYGAWKILPSVYDMPLVKTWAGLRPASRDHAPILGTTNIDGLIVAMGMYRHGILLCPLVGRLIANLILQEDDSPFLKRFALNRLKTFTIHKYDNQTFANSQPAI